MKPTGRLLSEYFKERFGASSGGVEVVPLGRGCHGQGFRVSFVKGKVEKRLIVKTLDKAVGLGHDYPSDRAAVFLQARAAYGRLPRHVRANDVLALGRGGVFSIDGGKEYYLVMEEAQGINYFDDLRAMGERGALSGIDRARIEALAGYLAEVHREKLVSPRLYYRKLRDIIGHGECLMGVLDTYDGASFTNLSEAAAIEKACIDWRARLKPMHGRLSKTHGDFHPGNIMFGSGKKASFTLLDRSRGEYGEPADDVTALTINYIFYSLMKYGRMAGPYAEALSLFFDEYLRASGDRDVLCVAAPFYAFRGVVVANPLFYPDVSVEIRRKIFGFVHGVLRAGSFEPGLVDGYIKKGLSLRKRFI